jgi:hypothetical protein
LNGAPSPFAFWSSAAPWLALVAFAVAAALLYVRAHERSTYLNTLWLFLVGLGGEAAAQLIWALNFLDAAGSVHSISRFVASIALIRLCGFALFRLLLPLARRYPPRIVEDLAIVAVYVVYGSPSCAARASTFPASSPPRPSSPRWWPSRCRIRWATCSPAWRCSSTTPCASATGSRSTT